MKYSSLSIRSQRRQQYSKHGSAFGAGKYFEAPFMPKDRRDEGYARGLSPDFGDGLRSPLRIRFSIMLGSIKSEKVVAWLEEMASMQRRVRVTVAEYTAQCW